MKAGARVLRPLGRRRLLSTAVALVTGGVTVLAGSPVARAAVPFEIQTLDGSRNNAANPTWGQVGTAYSRVAPARYADGVSAPPSGPNSRFISNRIHNDSNQNLFSETQVSQWGFVWGQFLDHTFGLRASTGDGATAANIPFNAGDPLEEFTNNLGVVPFTRSATTPGTGTGNPRQQTNTVSSYIDAWAVYGGTNERLEWLREGSVDGNVTNNSGRLLLPGDYLPRRTSRNNPAAAPAMDADGRLAGNPNNAAVAGDVRANENAGLTATHTLFAREHNRIVGLLPNTLSEEDKFQIARRIVAAEQQYITYNEFLPAMGINLPAYASYRPGVNANLTNEFAVVGYRAHSMIHGEFELETEAGRYSQATLDALEDLGAEIAIDGDDIEIAVPLNLAFFNPDLIQQLQLGPLLQGIGLEAQYKNDEQIDNQLRSVLFQIPVSGNPECLDGPGLPECFQGVIDLGAIDIERGRDHGMPTYNQLRQAYGLPARTTFRAITGEAGEAFPNDPELTPGNQVNDPDSLDFTEIRNVFGTRIAEDDEDALEGDGTVGTRRTPVAARLNAIYNGNVNNVDPFVGMVAEPHVPGSQFGELQRAIWTREFQRLRDGDRFFYGNQGTALNFIRNTYGIDFRRNLGDIIAANTDIPRSELAPNVFFVHGDVPPTSCRVEYTLNTQWGTGSGGFQATTRITNTGTRPLNGWTLRFSFPNGQQITEVWNGTAEQNGVDVPIVNAPWNGVIAPGQSVGGVGFNATWSGTNGKPPRFSVNTAACSVT
jgi:hypothetical protein